MAGDPFLRVEIELTLQTEPISGRLRTDRDPEHEFTGVLELIGLLDQARDAAESEASGDSGSRTRRS
jgi:hypothetical protein